VVTRRDVPTDAVLHWDTETKYYKATLNIHSRTYDACQELGVIEPQAMLFVFDIFQPETFGAVMANYGWLFDRFHCEVVLAIGLRGAVRSHQMNAATGTRSRTDGPAACLGKESEEKAEVTAKYPSAAIAAAQERRQGWCIDNQVHRYPSHILVFNVHFRLSMSRLTWTMFIPTGRTRPRRYPKVRVH